ncbi:hypothetical protein BJ875DRAFT_260034 [Amylocarpus encephaloides]|uniref:Uncharacterized protein n=1 Tax=Amylocarpus encephaloides TaxID=45428 RepID=A0A9P7Y7X3_9HELO|nr:hypothetical protein BJ875DRAFT_260034 [Amylocarpus encephaloides]
MDFAPYQDQSPETQRTLSPPPVEGRRSFSPALASPTKAPSPPNANPWASSSANAFGADGNHADPEGARVGRLNEFETSLPIRLDYEACLAYLLLPPAGGVLLLVLERKSDYVRFHAWQSSLLFAAIFVVHLIFSWSTFISWLLFTGDIVLIAYLTMRAYRDADTLDRCEVPFFGRLASSILDDE